MAAISAVCSGPSGPVQPNMVFENVARWSKGSTYNGRSYPIAMDLTSSHGDVYTLGVEGFVSAYSITTERVPARYECPGTAGAVCQGTISCGESSVVSIHRRHGRPSPRSGSSNSSGSQN